MAGLGHLQRCLSLAAALRAHDWESLFDVEEGKHYVAAAGFQTGEPVDPPAVIVDSYEATEEELLGFGRNGAKVIAIDDLADRPLPVDLVINPGIGAEALEYHGPRRVALGVRYALLRPEFRLEPQRQTPPVARRILITMGGADPQHLTAGLVSRLAGAGFDVVDVIVGPFFGETAELQEVARLHDNVVLHERPRDVRPLMLQADLAVSAAGQTLYELAATATPIVAIQVASNQDRNVAGFLGADAIVFAGSAERPDLIESVAAAVAGLAADPARRIGLGGNARRLVDGLGAERAAVRILEELEMPQ